jgi:hypothetical protein
VPLPLAAHFVEMTHASVFRQSVAFGCPAPAPPVALPVIDSQLGGRQPLRFAQARQPGFVLRMLFVLGPVDVSATLVSATLVSMDFFTVPTLTGRVLFVFVLLAHHRRRIVHFNVTEHPTAAWTLQQFREVLDNAPRPGSGSQSHGSENPQNSVPIATGEFPLRTPSWNSAPELFRFFDSYQ